MKKNWNINRTDTLSGKTVIVTGANTGLGYETARALALRGASVVLACRDQAKAETAASEIAAEKASAHVETSLLNLASLDSVRAFADRFKAKHNRLDILVNNAGVMMPPKSVTEDGFELQWGVNHLGHFLLTSLLFPVLSATKNSRVVHLASLAHKWGEIYFEDLNFEKKYNKSKAYGQSKLACLMFGYEMQRRLEKSGSHVKSLIAHPGISDTELSRYLPKWVTALSPLFTLFFAQSARAGAEPQLRAATDADLKGGEYLGPSGFGEYKGKPVIVDSTDLSKDKAVAKKLWEVSEKAVGAEFAIGQAAVAEG